MKHRLIPTIQQELFGQRLQKNELFYGLFYATLEVLKVLSLILSSFVEKIFLNHMLIIMTTWMGMFLKTGLKILY